MTFFITQVSVPELWIPIVSPLTVFSRSDRRATTACSQVCKKMPREKRFDTNDKVISDTKAFFEGRDNSFHDGGIEMSEKRWNECVTLKGDYANE